MLRPNGCDCTKRAFENAVEFWLLVAAVMLVSTGFWSWIVASYLAVRSLGRLSDGMTMRRRIHSRVLYIDLTSVSTRNLKEIYRRRRRRAGALHEEQ